MNSKIPGYTYADHAQHIVAECELASRSGSDVNLHALIDVAQLNGLMSALPNRLQRLRQRHGWAEPELLYANTFAASANALSPLLLQLPTGLDGGAAAKEALVELSDLFAPVPVLSFIASSLSSIEIVQHLQALLLIDTDDNQSFLLRLADTHALTSTMRVLVPAQRGSVLRCLSGWWVVDQRGRRIDLHALERATPATPLPLKFSAAQLDALMQASSVSIVAAQLRQADSVFANLPWPEQIDHVACHAERAQAAGFATMDDLLGWCAAARRGGDRFDQHPLVRMALLEASISEDPKRLSEAFDALSDDDWLAVRSVPTPSEIT